jgi:hypothetical protein
MIIDFSNLNSRNHKTLKVIGELGATAPFILIPIVGPLTAGIQIGLAAGCVYDAYKTFKANKMFKAKKTVKAGTQNE